MIEQGTLAQRFRDLHREANAPDWSTVLHRAEAMADELPHHVNPQPPRPQSRGRLPRRLQARRRTTLIAVVVAVTAMGFAGVAFSLNRPSLPFTAPGPEDAAVLRKAPGTEEKPRHSPRVDGQTWGLRSYQNVRGELCFSHDVPGELTEMGCMPTDKLFERGPLYARWGARQIAGPPITLEWDNQWVWGIAHPDIETLTLVSMDCSTVQLELDPDGAFHHVVGRDDIRNGKQQYKLIARGTRGELLVETDVAMNPPRLGKDAGHEAPRPKESCR